MLSSVTKQVFTAWLTVPSLRAMAWEAVCHYTPHIAKLPKVNFLKTFIAINLTEENMSFFLPSLIAYFSRQAALLAEGVPSGCLETLKSPAEQAAVCG